MAFLDEIDKHKEFATFIKTTTPAAAIDSSQKVALNRKGNVLLNNGDVEGARKIFTATLYGDGLVRVGKKYENDGRPLDALKQYLLAKNERGLEGVYTRAAQAVSCVMSEPPCNIQDIKTQN